MIHKMIEKDVDSGTFDMASDDTRLLKDYVKEAHRVIKAKNKLNFGERPDSIEKFAIPNISKTLEAIGAFDFTTFEEGIKKIAKSI